ncbi:MAG: hypothetical protein ACW98A_17450 [Candidatus Hodarchaeales archaeon]|jgi:Na+/melibiose symporter-like transporter
MSSDEEEIGYYPGHIPIPIDHARKYLLIVAKIYIVFLMMLLLSLIIQNVGLTLLFGLIILLMSFIIIFFFFSYREALSRERKAERRRRIYRRCGTTLYKGIEFCYFCEKKIPISQYRILNPD